MRVKIRDVFLIIISVFHGHSALAGHLIHLSGQKVIAVAKEEKKSYKKSPEKVTELKTLITRRASIQCGLRICGFSQCGDVLAYSLDAAPQEEKSAHTYFDWIECENREQKTKTSKQRQIDKLDGISSSLDLQSSLEGLDALDLDQALSSPLPSCGISATIKTKKVRKLLSEVVHGMIPTIRSTLEGLSGHTLASSPPIQTKMPKILTPSEKAAQDRSSQFFLKRWLGNFKDLLTLEPVTVSLNDIQISTMQIGKIEARKIPVDELVEEEAGDYGFLPGWNIYDSRESEEDRKHRAYLGAKEKAEFEFTIELRNLRVRTGMEIKSGWSEQGQTLASTSVHPDEVLPGQVLMNVKQMDVDLNTKKTGQAIVVKLRVSIDDKGQIRFRDTNRTGHVLSDVYIPLNAFAICYSGAAEGVQKGTLNQQELDPLDRQDILADFRNRSDAENFTWIAQFLNHNPIATSLKSILQHTLLRKSIISSLVEGLNSQITQLKKSSGTQPVSFGVKNYSMDAFLNDSKALKQVDGRSSEPKSELTVIPDLTIRGNSKLLNITINDVSTAAASGANQRSKKVTFTSLSSLSPSLPSEGEISYVDSDPLLKAHDGRFDVGIESINDQLKKLFEMKFFNFGFNSAASRAFENKKKLDLAVQVSVMATPRLEWDPERKIHYFHIPDLRIQPSGSAKLGKPFLFKKMDVKVFTWFEKCQESEKSSEKLSEKADEKSSLCLRTEIQGAHQRKAYENKALEKLAKMLSVGSKLKNFVLQKVVEKYLQPYVRSTSISTGPVEVQKVVPTPEQLSFYFNVVQ